MSKLKFKTPRALHTKTAAGLVGKCVLLLVLPYVYLLLCGFVFDYLLRWYFMTGFIFWTMVLLYVLAAALIVWLLVQFVRDKKGGV